MAGAPASVDWHPVRSPPNEYVNGCDVVLRPGVNDAVPLSWQPPLAADALDAKLNAHSAATTTWPYPGHVRNQTNRGGVRLAAQNLTYW